MTKVPLRPLSFGEVQDNKRRKAAFRSNQLKLPQRKKTYIVDWNANRQNIPTGFSASDLEV